MSSLKMKREVYFPLADGEGAKVSPWRQLRGAKAASVLAGHRHPFAHRFDLSLSFSDIDMVKSLHNFGACSHREFPPSTVHDCD
jgi:hypothetical protein